MKTSLIKVVSIIIKALLLISFGKLISLQIEENRLKEPIFGDFIQKGNYMVWGDNWPFTVEKAAIYCKGNNGNYSLYIGVGKNFYSLNDKAKKQLGYPPPYEILRPNLNPNLEKKGVKFDYEHIIKRARSNCDLRSRLKNQ